MMMLYRPQAAKVQRFSEFFFSFQRFSAAAISSGWINKSNILIVTANIFVYKSQIRKGF